MDAAEPFEADFDLPTWMDDDEARRLMSTSSGDDSVFEPTPASMPTYSKPLVEARPTLQPRDAVVTARSAYGTAQAQSFVPTLLSHFETNLLAPELTERLPWLWLMRRDIATQVCDVILRGRLLHRRPENVSAELLDLTELLATDTVTHMTKS